MQTIDICGTETEFVCTAYTTTVYEHEFVSDANPRITGDIIADVMGCIRSSTKEFLDADEDGNLTIVFDYTKDNWAAYKRALWAMVRTAAEIRSIRGQGYATVPHYREWETSLVEWEPDMRDISFRVCQELQRGLFRAGAAASEKTSEWEPQGQAPVHDDHELGARDGADEE